MIAKREDLRDLCTCIECLATGNACESDCEKGQNECEGCYHARREQEEMKYETDNALGRV